MNFKVGDEVVVITGSDKGKKGKIDISSSDYLEGKMVFTERI